MPGPHKWITNGLSFKELGGLVSCLCPKNKQSKEKTELLVRMDHTLGLEFLQDLVSGQSHNWDTAWGAGGRGGKNTAPGLSLSSIFDMRLIKSFPKKHSAELKFPISVSEKWEIGASGLLSQTLRARNCPSLRQQTVRSFMIHRSFHGWVMLVLEGRKPSLLRSPWACAKDSEEQVASWGQTGVCLVCLRL